MPGSERAVAGGAVRVRRALLPASLLLLPLPSAGRSDPAGDGGAGLSFSAGTSFATVRGQGGEQAAPGGRERGTLGKGGMAVRGGRRGRLRSLSLSLTASRGSPQPVAGALCLGRTRGPGAEPRGLVASRSVGAAASGTLSLAAEV